MISGLLILLLTIVIIKFYKSGYDKNDNGYQWEVPMKKYTKLIMLIVGVAIMYGVIKQFQLDQLITFENLHENKMRLHDYVSAHYFQSVLMYIGIYILVIALNLPGAGVMTFSGGVLFGILPAMLFVNISATIGGGIAFIVARKFFGIFIQNKFGERLQKFNDDIDRHGKNYLLTMRLIPIFPFFFVNIAAGLTKISFMTFVWTTSLGTIPGTFAYVFAGHNISNIAGGEEILSPPVIAALVIFGLMSIGPTIINKKREAKRLKEEMSE